MTPMPLPPYDPRISGSSEPISAKALTLEESIRRLNSCKNDDDETARKKVNNIEIKTAFISAASQITNEKEYLEFVDNFLSKIDYTPLKHLNGILQEETVIDHSHNIYFITRDKAAEILSKYMLFYIMPYNLQPYDKNKDGKIHEKEIKNLTEFLNDLKSVGAYEIKSVLILHLDESLKNKIIEYYLLQ